MCREDHITEKTENSIASHIEETFRIKEAFDYSHYDGVLEYLPKKMKSDYLKIANMFCQLQTFKILENKKMDVSPKSKYFT